MSLAWTPTFTAAPMSNGLPALRQCQISRSDHYRFLATRLSALSALVACEPDWEHRRRGVAARSDRVPDPAHAAVVPVVAVAERIHVDPEHRSFMLCFNVKDGSPAIRPRWR